MNRTAKYFFAILKGIWIVSYDWLLECKKGKCWVPEGPYEIQGDNKGGRGPKKSRQSENHQFLQGYSLYVEGPVQNRLRPSVVEQILKYGGAHILNTKAKVIQAAKLQVNEPLDMEDFKIIVLTDTPCKFKLPGIVNLRTDWLLDSVCQYELLPFRNYLHYK